MEETEFLRGRALKRRCTILLVVFAVVLVGFPTYHSGTREEPYTEYETVSKSAIIKTFDINQTLAGYQSLQMNWTITGPDESSETRGSIQSTANISVRIVLVECVKLSRASQTYGYSYGDINYNYSSNFMPNGTWEIQGPNGTWEYFYSSEDEMVTRLIIIENPNPVQVIINGTLGGYHTYQDQFPVTKYRTVKYEQWLPWWMP